MPNTTTCDSQPICTAVLLVDTETVKALQQQLNVPLRSDHSEEEENDYDDVYHDAHANHSSSFPSSTRIRRLSSKSSSSSTATAAKILNFVTGLCTGVMFCCGGFSVLLQHWQNMSPIDVVLFSVVWSIVTSVTAYLLFNLLYIGTCYYCPNSSNSRCLESPQTISILESCFFVAIFLGFCGACTRMDVANGTPASIIILTEVAAAFWACLMIDCALSTFMSNRKPAAAKPAEKRKPKALATKKRQ